MRSLIARVVLLAPRLVVGCRSQSAASSDWVRIRREDLPLTVEVTGKLAAVNTDILGPPPVPEKWDFKISTMVPEGASVKKNDVILAFDAMDLQRRLEASATPHRRSSTRRSPMRGCRVATKSSTSPRPKLGCENPPEARPSDGPHRLTRAKGDAARS